MGLKRVFYLSGLMCLTGCCSIRFETERDDEYLRQREFERTYDNSSDRTSVFTLFRFSLGVCNERKERGSVYDFNNFDEDILRRTQYGW